MNRFLLDTNVVSELRKSSPHGGVLAWLDAHESEQLFLSAATVGEIQAGIERTRRQNPLKARELDMWLAGLPAVYQLLPMDMECFREWGRLMDGKSNDLLMDAMIAATARVHRLTVATRNERDFTQFEVRMVNPFKS